MTGVLGDARDLTDLLTWAEGFFVGGWRLRLGPRGPSDCRGCFGDAVQGVHQYGAGSSPGSPSDWKKGNGILMFT